MTDGDSPAKSWRPGLTTGWPRLMALLALLELAETAAGSSAACTGSIAGAWSHGAEQYDVSALDPAVRQLRHHLGPSLWDILGPPLWDILALHPFPPPHTHTTTTTHTHTVYCALLGYRAYWMLIGACDPML